MTRATLEALKREVPNAYGMDAKVPSYDHVAALSWNAAVDACIAALQPVEAGKALGEDDLRIFERFVEEKRLLQKSLFNGEYDAWLDAMERCLRALSAPAEDVGALLENLQENKVLTLERRPSEYVCFIGHYQHYDIAIEHLSMGQKTPAAAIAEALKGLK